MGRSAGGEAGDARERSRAVWRTATILGAGVLLLYLGLCANMFLRQESFVYFPDATLKATPAAVRLPYDEARLAASDAHELGAWWIPAKPSRGAVVLCQGNAGNRSDRLDKALFLHAQGLSLLMFDYRGYGGNAGKPFEEGTYRDAAAAVRHVTAVRGVPAARLILWGESLGGAVALETALRSPPAALVLESTFTSVPAMARHYYPWLPAGLLARIRYDSLSKIPRLACPLLVLHGPADEIVPYPMGRALFEAATVPKAFGELRRGHNDGGIVVSPDAQRSAADFVDRVLGEKRG